MLLAARMLQNRVQLNTHTHTHATHHRLQILYEDWHAVKRLLAKAKTICEAGGDWEHKNKLKVRPCSGGERAIRRCLFARAASRQLQC